MATIKANADGGGPQISAQRWFALAISSAIITCTMAGFAALWILGAPSPGEGVQRAQMFTPFGAAMLAVVTFCTVAWRGVLNTEQLKQQIRQNDAKDEENLAKLLQEGAKLLGEDRNVAHQLAGIASIEALFTERANRFGQQAVDLLAGYYATQATADAPLSNRAPADSARRALIKAHSKGISSTIEYVPDAVGPLHSWPAVCGFARQHYEGGTISQASWAIVRNDPCTFKRVVVSKCALPYEVDHGRFDDCAFVGCTIKYIDSIDYIIYSNSFKKCNFSGCEFNDDTIPVLADKLQLLEGENWFDISDPPRSENFDAWSEILIPKRVDQYGRFVPVNAKENDLRLEKAVMGVSA